MKKAIVLDIDETLVVRTDNDTGAMCLRENFDLILDGLREAKENNIDVVICTSAPEQRAEQVFNLCPEMRDLVDKVYGREYLESVGYGYEIQGKPVYNFGYDKILFIDDNCTEGKELVELFSENKIKDTDITFIPIDSPVEDVRKISYFLDSDLKTGEYINSVNNYFKFLKEEPAAEFMKNNIKEFINDNNFENGLKIIGSEYRVKRCLSNFYKTNIDNINIIKSDYFDEYKGEAFELFKGLNRLLIDSDSIGIDNKINENFSKDKINFFDGLDEIRPEFFEKNNEINNENINKAIIINVDDVISNNYGNESILRENVDVLIEQLKEAKENNIDVYFYTDITNPDCKSLFSLRPELKNIVDNVFVHEDYLNPKPVIETNYDKIFYVDNSHRELGIQIDDFLNKNPEKEIIYYDLEESFGRPSSLRKLMEVKLEDEKDINFVKNYFEIIKSDPTLPILADKINEFTYDDNFNPGLDIVSRTFNSNLAYYEEKLGSNSNIHISYFEGNDLERMNNFISEAFDASWHINAEMIFGKEQIQWDVEKECYLFESRESVIDGLDRIHPEFFDKENEKNNDNEKDNDGFDLTD